MKKRSKKVIAEDRAYLKDFLAVIPEGRLKLALEFNYSTMAAINQWLIRGIPDRIRESVYDYVTTILLEKQNKKRATK